MFTNSTAKVATFEDRNNGNRLVKILDIKNGHQQNFQFDFLSFNGFYRNQFSKTVIQRYENVNMVLGHFSAASGVMTLQVNPVEDPIDQLAIPTTEIGVDFDEIIGTFKVLIGLMKIEDFDGYCHWRGCGRGKLRNPAELVKVCTKTFGFVFPFNSLMTEILGSTIVAIMYFFHCSI